MERTKFLLDGKDMPTSWYNILPDLPEPLPPVLHPGTGSPVTPDDLAPLFPMGLIMQEFSPEQYIDIPEEVQEIYRTWRPTTLHRAHRLEKALDTPAKIFYKYEGTSQPGSHKPNTAVAQAYYNKKEGIKRIASETGAGQWGSSIAFACALFGLELKVYMVKVSYNQKPYRRIMMETWGANCVPSPSPDTKAGRDMLAIDPDCPGSLGLAISEAVEDAATREDTHYSLGSVLNHVLLHQTIIGQEAMKQMEMANAYPDIIVGCIGGGSNFAGMFLPFVKDKIGGRKPDLRIINVEPTSCPTLTKGLYAYDFGDAAGMTPLLKMHTLGHEFIPPAVHAGGLRYHGMAPIICHLHKLGLVEARAVPQVATFEAGVTFARTEGIISAPETNHAIRATIDEALKCKESGESKTILLAHSGHGHFDMAAYESYLSGKLTDYEYPEEKVKEALAHLPGTPTV
ncbi:MAG: TrpB-like pyridoxal phosphate-dependent enzyme [Dehalococcoidales bacterium]|jgi:tryptophan synthase beta chain|nr:TrpB-like pyridoxal phosphate-dependent enzyme [Dehalococcoidales bacterium]MDP7110226.1 TrpB-like pyridoxal phosphate-dependent enzyme [Dehalococcoidales bacterium]MDP7310165.1 TrpB-like pyridoxal phosphate-dependent enzyme [Dehalococcoidales bacterium]MDP7409157.1 TrpB-like pyridoxal phosphate-dependent enzyme [Dehalococcoidales bacterium]MDP7675491.1 TrpB-like pyridoxal phosphate-dependent enzyme [Dehalococcoidales bacterium]